jgi:hypothetical protein
MEDATQTAENSTDNSENSTDNSEKPKKKVRRKPLWLLIPSDFVTLVSGDSTEEKPDRYRLVECHSKKQIQVALTDAGIDATNYQHVRLLRADPTPLQIQSQTIIKWK